MIRKILEAIDEKELHPSLGLSGKFRVTTMAPDTAQDLPEQHDTLEAALVAAGAWFDQAVAQDPGNEDGYDVIVFGPQGEAYDRFGNMDPGEDED